MSNTALRTRRTHRLAFGVVPTTLPTLVAGFGTGTSVQLVPSHRSIRSLVTWWG